MKHHLLLSIVFGFFFLICAPLAADVDPEGEDFRDKLREKVLAAEQQSFKDLVEAEPDLSKRAFVVEVLKAWESRPEEASPPLIGDLAKQLAEQIREVHGDVKPIQILDRFEFKYFDVATYELARYAENVFPAYAESPVLAALNLKNLERGVHYGAGLERRAEYDDWGFYIVYPLALNSLRGSVTEAYLDPKLLIQELELGPKFFKLRNERLREINPEAESLESAEADEKANEESTKVAARAMMVAFGLNSDIDAESLSKIDSMDADARITILIIRFQAAYRGSRLDDARSHLAAIETLVSESSKEFPALFHFLLRTMRFQSRLDEVQVTKDEVLSSFQAAWGELSEYKPAVRIVDDEDWWAAREAVRYWIDLLSGLDGETRRENLKRIYFDLLDWAVEGRENPVQAYYTSSELWLQNREVGVYLTQLLTITDLMIYLLENARMRWGEAQDLPQALDLLDSITLRLGEVPKDFNLNPGDPLFGELRLEDSSLMRELKLRLAYIRVMAEGANEEDKVQGLLAIAPDLKHLDRPESYIHYHHLFAREFQGRGKPELAIPLLETSLQKAEQYSFRRKEIDLAAQLAEIYSAQANWEMAAFYSDRAKSILQSVLQTSAPRDALDVGRQGRNVGDLHAIAHLKSDNPQAAFEALSQGQQLQSAATQLAANRTARGDLNSIASRQQSVDVLERQVQSLESLPESTTKTEILEINRKQLAQTRSEFMLESRKIRAKYPKLYTTTLRFDPLVLPDIQGALPPGTAVVQYFSTAEEMFLFVVTSESFRLTSVSFEQRELDELVLAYLKKLKEVNSKDAALTGLSQKLHSLLIEPISQDLASSDTLILIPTGRLNTLPFSSLLDSSAEPLLAKKRLVSLAKATDFMRFAGNSPKPVSGMVAFANATLDLPSAEREGEKIKEIFPDSKLFVGLEANRSNLFKFATGADVLHLATHGLSDPVNALNNYLALSGDGKLSQEEIFNLELADTTLVTLSACNTALSNSTEFEFVASIAEAFWIAGSRSVVASIWPVDDASTEILMTEFYRGLKEKGLGKAEALQRAQLAVRTDPRFEHPFFWAGFILFGDYR